VLSRRGLGDFSVYIRVSSHTLKSIWDA
jgi:hypothetical protein